MPMTMKIKNPPSDTISSLTYASTLLCSSWNSSICLYNTSSNKLLFSSHFAAPVLASRFLDEDRFVSGDLEGNIHLTTFKDSKVLLNARSLAPAEPVAGAACGDLCSVKTIDVYRKQVLAGTWNNKLAVCDPGSGGVAQVIALPGRVLSSSVLGDTLALALANNTVQLVDLRNATKVLSRQNAIADTKLTAVKLMRDAKAAADILLYASTGAKVCVSYLGDLYSSKTYVFKCHRAEAGGVETLFPVTALEVGDGGEVLTGGMDGHIYEWDIYEKKKTRRVAKYEKGVTHIALKRGSGAPEQSLAVGTGRFFQAGSAEDSKENSDLNATAALAYTREPCEIHIV